MSSMNTNIFSYVMHFLQQTCEDVPLAVVCLFDSIVAAECMF